MEITKAFFILILVMVFNPGFMAYAEESATEKVSATANKAKNLTKETYRNSKDELCELINGKMKCVAQKVKHKAQNAADDAAAKAKELKNKVD